MTNATIGHGAATDEGAIHALLVDLDTAASALDVDGFLHFFVDGPQTLFAVDGCISEGLPAIREMHRAGWSQLRTVTFRSTLRSILHLAADGVVVTAAGKALRTDADGTMVARDYALTLVLVRRPEGWRVLQAHESIPRT
jgi:uncharacterized protein (TIGR02246 family)